MLLQVYRKVLHLKMLILMFDENFKMYVFYDLMTNYQMFKWTVGQRVAIRHYCD